jgi:tape measure domain-containing protein
MAQQNRRDIELALSVTTANAEALSKLRDDVKELAKSGGDAAPEFKKLADSLGSLETQAKALTALDSVTQELKANEQAYQEASDKAKFYRDELARLQAATDAAKTAQAQAAAEYRQANASVQDIAAQIRELKRSTDDHTAANTAYTTQLRQLQTAEEAARRTKRELGVELEKAKANTQAAAQAQAELGREYRALQPELNKAVKGYQALEREADTLLKTLNQSGAAAQDFGSAQASVVQSLEQVKTAIRETVAEVQRKEAADRAAAAESERLAIIELNTKRQLQAQARAEAEGVIRDYQRMEQAQREAAAAAQAAGQRVRDAFSDVGVKSVNSLREQIERVRESMRLLASSGSATGAELDQAFRSGQTRIRELEREIREATGSLTMMDKAAGLLKTTVGQLAAFVSLVEVVERTGRAFITANANIESMRLGLTSIYEDAGTASDQIDFLRGAADRAGVSFNDISNAFTKFSASAKFSNIPLAESNALFAELARVSGVLGLSSVKAEQALEAISQIAAKGTVSLEELRQQLGDAIPGAVALTAKGLGVTTEELFKLVEAGQVSAREFFPAFTKSLTEIQGESNTLTAAWQRLQNAISLAFQKLGDAGVTNALKDALNGLASVVRVVADNMGVLTASAEALFKVFAAARIATFVQSMFGLRQSTQAAAVAVVEATAATTANTAANTANTTATVANTTAKVANAAANRALAGSLTGLNAQINATAAAARASAAASTAAATSGGLLARGLGAIGGALGGPVGVLALTALYAKDLGELAAKAVLWAKGQDNLEESTRKMEEADKAARKAAEERKQQLDAQKAAAEKATQAQFGLTKSGIELVKNLEDLKTRGELTADAIANIGKDFDLSTTAGIQNAGSVLDALLQKGIITSEQFKAAWAKALDGQDLATFGFNAQLAFGTAGRGVEQLAFAMDAQLAAAVSRTGVDIRTLGDQMTETSVKAVNDVDTLIGGMDRLRAQGLDVGAVLTASISKGIDTADSQAAVEQLRVRIEEVRNVLGNTVANGLLDQAKQKADELRVSLENATPGINSVAEAMRQLGVTTQASLDDAARKAAQAYEVIRNSGTATTRELQQAFEAYARAAVAANNGVVSSAVRAEAAARGMKVEADSSGRLIVQRMDEARAATERVGEAAKNAAGGFMEMADAAGKVATSVEGRASRTTVAPDGLQIYMDKKAAGTLTAADTELVRNLITSTSSGLRQAERLGVRYVSGSPNGAAALLTQLRADLEKLEAGAARTNSVAPSSAPTAPRATTTPVNVNINGSTRQINTASQQDAFALAEMLRQLDAMSTRATI